MCVCVGGGGQRCIQDFKSGGLLDASFQGPSENKNIFSVSRLMGLNRGVGGGGPISDISQHSLLLVPALEGQRMPPLVMVT